MLRSYACRVVGFIAVGVVLASAKSTATAQTGKTMEQGRRDATPVVIVVADKNTSYQLVEVLRRSAVMPHDVIIVPRNRLTAAWLGEAVQTVLVARGQTGLLPAQDARILVTGSVDKKRYKHSDFAIRWVSILNDAAPQNVPGVGFLPTLVVYLPNEDVPKRVP